MSAEPPSSTGKVITSCAITGLIHVPSMTPHLPITPSQIAESAIGAAEAGAAIVHLHARDPEDGRPTPDPEVYARFLPDIQESSDVIINITTGGGHGMALEERTAAARRFLPELCSLNMGSMNFGPFPVLDRMKDREPGNEWHGPTACGARAGLRAPKCGGFQRHRPVLRSLGRPIEQQPLLRHSPPLANWLRAGWSRASSCSLRAPVASTQATHNKALWVR